MMTKGSPRWQVGKRNETLPENAERLSVLSEFEDESVTGTKKTKQMKNKQEAII